ncbi:MAG: 1-acyl-sn-glycerol-3-phosphate acyltransferase [Saprospiraceae bacterium]|nr:1-acyl-sn-glycerol-3-phosphate acyltransferase [Saprospiraceae bacterium]
MAYRNAPLHPFLRLIYVLLRVLSWLGIVVFYRRRLLLGRENLRFDGPAIVIVNHPNTLLDVLVSGIHIRQEMFFLANYGLFKHPVSNWLLRRLFCIPVKRREDVADGEARDLDSTFEQCYRHLEKGGVLFIAAEGVSWMNRWVRELKTGTARISFGAEARNNWQLEVKIIPIGLSYNAPNLFRSDSVVNVGAPVWPRDWADAWKKDHEAAVNNLTDFLEHRLKWLTIHTRDEAGEQLTGRLETLLHNSRPATLREEFFRSRVLVEKHLDNTLLSGLVGQYFEQMKQRGLSDAGIFSAASPGSGTTIFLKTLALLAGFPFFLIGYLFWFLPCFLPSWLNRKMGLYIGYSSNVKILAGLITFPLALWGFFKGAKFVLNNNWLALAATAATIPLGLLTEKWLHTAAALRQHRFAHLFARRQPEQFAQLLALRNQIMPLIR